MGDPKKTKKHYESPKKPWDKGRLEQERNFKNTYGLKNKKELWRIETILRKKRINARNLLALPLEERKKRERELLDSLERRGLISKNATLDDVLSLTVESLLERRLQTMVWRKGLADTPKQARQFITHGHVAVNGTKVDAPGYLVSRSDEEKIAYFGKEMYLGEKEKPKISKEKKKEIFEEVAPAEEEVEEIEEESPAEVEAPEKKVEEVEEEGETEKETKEAESVEKETKVEEVKE